MNGRPVHIVYQFIHLFRKCLYYISGSAQDISDEQNKTKQRVKTITNHTNKSHFKKSKLCNLS